MRCLSFFRNAAVVVDFKSQSGSVAASFLPEVPQQRDSASASRARLQSRQLHGHAGPATGDGALVADHAPGEVGQNRRQDGPPRPLHHLPDGRGRRLGKDVRANPGADRWPARAAGAGLTCAAMVERKTAGEVCLDGKRTASQPPKNVIRRQPLGPTTVLPTRIGIRMAIVAQNRYSDARNWRSSGVCRFNPAGSCSSLYRAGLAANVWMRAD